MVSNLKGGPGDNNEVTTVLPVCETSDVAAQKAILKAMTPIAEKFIAEANAQGEDSPRMAFLIVSRFQAYKNEVYLLQKQLGEQVATWHLLVNVTRLVG